LNGSAFLEEKEERKRGRSGIDSPSRSNRGGEVMVKPALRLRSGWGRKSVKEKPAPLARSK